MMIYDATVTREAPWWVITFRDEPGLAGQVRRLRDVAETAQALAAAWHQHPREEVQVRLVIELPEEAQQLLSAATSTEQEGRQALVRAGELRRAAVARLTDAGLTQRDVATALGLSPQRIHQLTQAAS